MDTGGGFRPLLELGEDSRLGIFALANFRKLVCLDHQNFGQMSENSTLVAILWYGSCKIFLKMKNKNYIFQIFFGVIRVEKWYFGNFGSQNWCFWDLTLL